MKKYVKPDVILVLLEYRDICLASGGTESVGGKNGLTLGDDYDFGGLWF